MPQGMWEFISQTPDRSASPAVEARSPNCGTVRELPQCSSKGYSSSRPDDLGPPDYFTYPHPPMPSQYTLAWSWAIELYATCSVI